MMFHSYYLIVVLFMGIDALKPIHLTIVACGDRVEEALTALKSSLIFTPGPIIFHVFTEDHLREEFTIRIDSEWPMEYRRRFEMKFYSIEFTRGNDERWRSLFKPCCTQRLFIPDILTNLDSVIYIDTDILFLTNVRNLWRIFRKFNSTQLAALTPEHEDPSMGWYNRFARHPYYGSMGLNSGVMLMNLTRMRQVDMLSKIINIFDEFHMNITWGDQCLLNIYFHSYPEQMYEFSCDWNYRPDHCIYENNCKTAEISGIKILHGCRSAFHNDKYEEFKSIYRIIHQWKFNSTLKSSLLQPMKINLEKFSLTNCGKSHELFTKHFSQQISSLKSPTSYHIALIENPHWNFLEQSSILLKSIRFFSNQSIHLHLILTQNSTRNQFSKHMTSLNYSITYYSTTTLNHPLELSKILNIDRLIYFYPNTILLNSLEKFWSLFDRFQPNQAIGMFHQCRISGNTNVLLLDINVMKNLNMNFEGIHQLSTDNIHFFPCQEIQDANHCQTIKERLFLSRTSDEELFEIVSQLIDQVDLNEFNTWKDSILNELNQIENVNCRTELIELLLTNKMLE